MRTLCYIILGLGAAIAGTGCHTPEYAVSVPMNTTRLVEKQPVTARYGPLEYHFMRFHDHLAIRIVNLTSDPIALVGSQSALMDPDGVEHPLHDRMLAPHSYSGMLLPAEPKTYPAYAAWNGNSFAWYDPMSGPLDNSYYYWPATSYYEVSSVYDWKWDKGTIRVRLHYERPDNSFEHQFEFAKE
jgi:hypothetical protein